MDTLQAIKRILVSDVLVEIPPELMRPEDELREGYGMDSLGFVELRVQCEEVFGVRISDEEFAADKLETLGDVVSLVDGLAGGQADRA
ncbi:acyl carrier protein [Lentzea sp. CA-135723]|uniref:acyl carrier protein n=1 Tax=Lentzea sp. CA-135723 TaxID=3239950 RepID=UPI003D8E4511